MGRDAVDAMKSRQEKNNLSELGVNWIGKGHLNASESDLTFKYHVAHLSDVYGGRSKVNNSTPRSVTNPPPWANLDPRVLSPIPHKKRREDSWDDKFFQANCLQSRGHIRAQRAPATKNGWKPTRRRPASAGVRRRTEEDFVCDANGAPKRRSRPSSACARGREAHHAETKRKGDEVSGGHGQSTCPTGMESRQRRSSEAVGSLVPGVEKRQQVMMNDGRSKYCHRIFSDGDKSILNGQYQLNEQQESTFQQFVSMLVDFDTWSGVRIANDAFREAQLATSLRDFTGYGEES